MRMKQSDGETTWRSGQGAQSGWVAGTPRTSGPLRNPASTTGNLRNPALNSGPLGGPGSQSPTSTGRTGNLSGRLPQDTSAQRALRAGGVGQWNQDDERDDSEGVVPFRQEYARAEAAAAPDPILIGLVRVVLFLVACVAAYSLQSHSQRHYVPGTASDGQVTQLSYDAGWPLTYAHVAVGAASVPLTNVEPTPAFHYVSPALLGVDVLLLALPLWVMLECLWALWAAILKRYGPRTLRRRLMALGFAALPALLWVGAGLVAGLIIAYGQIDPGSLPRFVSTALEPLLPGFMLTIVAAVLSKLVLPLLVPLLPGFGLAIAAAAVLSIPPTHWQLDIGLYLLGLFFPLLLLTALFYVYGCLFGRGFRRLFKRR